MDLRAVRVAADVGLAISLWEGAGMLAIFAAFLATGVWFFVNRERLDERGETINGRD